MNLVNNITSLHESQSRELHVVRILSFSAGIQGMVLTLHVLPMVMKLLYSHPSLTMRWAHIPEVGQLENLRMQEGKKLIID